MKIVAAKIVRPFGIAGFNYIKSYITSVDLSDLPLYLLIEDGFDAQQISYNEPNFESNSKKSVFDASTDLNSDVGDTDLHDVSQEKKRYIAVKMEEIRYMGNKLAVRFFGVNSIDSAKTLVNRMVYTDLDDMRLLSEMSRREKKESFNNSAKDELRNNFIDNSTSDFIETKNVDGNSNEFFVQDIIGCTVKLTNGDVLGVVTQFHNFGANDILELSNGTMLPFIDEYLHSVNIEYKEIVYHPIQVE